MNRHRALAVAVLTTLAVATAFAGIASASPNLTAVVGAPIILQNRVVVNVPVTVVCDSLGLESNIGDLVSITVQQANGRDIAVGTGSIGAANGFLGLGSPTLFTCDGTTANHVVVPVTPNTGSVPFKGGQAVITALLARHSEGSGCSQFFCATTQSESTSLPAPLSIKIKS
jgi:hypothetical protein